MKSHFILKPICLLFSLILFKQFQPSSSAVLGIDFGSDKIKVAAVVPGRSFDIVLDEASKRAHPALVVFDDDVRQYGTSASSLVAKRPLNSFLQFNRLLGKSFECDIINDLKSYFIFNELVKDETRNTITYVSPYYDPSKIIEKEVEDTEINTEIESNDDGTEIETEEDDDDDTTDILNIIASEPTISVEEIMTMKLKHIKSMAEKEMDSDIKDCVITVPEFWSYKERQSLLDSSQMAGLNVLGLINENTAAALQYALNRDYSENKTEIILFYNMGATSTKVNIVKYFQQDQSKKSKKSKKTNDGTGAFEVISTTWDEKLGAMNFDREIAKIIIERSFEALKNNKNLKNDPSSGDFTDSDFLNELRIDPRFTARIRSASVRAKKILSANTETFVSIEGIYKDEDFSTSITRQELYDKTTYQFTRVRELLDEVVLNSGFDKEDIDAIVLLGGGTRIPKVRSILTDYLGKPLKEDLNADEAPALGAAFRAANLSSTFRVRSVGMDDITPFPVGVRLTDLIKDGDIIDDTTKTFKKRGSLFGLNNHLFRRRAVTLKHSKDLKVALFYEKTAPLPIGTSREIATYEITGIPKAIKKYMEDDNDANTKYNITELPKISLSFLLDANGIVDLVSATAAFTEWVTETKEVKTTKSDKQDESDEDKPDDESEATSTNSEQDNKETDTEPKAESDTESSESVPGTDTEIETISRKRTHRVDLTIQRFGATDVVAYSNVDFARSAKLLLELDERDRSVRETADARNELESYIFESRSKIYNEKNVELVTNSDEREEFISILEIAEDWIWDVEEESAGVFKSKIRELKKTGNAMFLRADEIEARPRAIDTAGKTLGQLYESVDMLRLNYTWINGTEIDKLQNMTKKVETWLNKKIEEQDEKTLVETPSFYSYEVYYKIEPIVEYTKKLLSRPKPYGWGVKKKSKKNNTNNTNTTNENEDGENEDLTSDINVNDGEQEENEENTDEDENDKENDEDDNDESDKGDL